MDNIRRPLPYINIHIHLFYEYLHLFIFQNDTPHYLKWGKIKRPFESIKNTILKGIYSIYITLRYLPLLWKIYSLLEGSFAKETYNFKEPTNRSHPIVYISHSVIFQDDTPHNLKNGKYTKAFEIYIECIPERNISVTSPYFPEWYSAQPSKWQT